MYTMQNLLYQNLFLIMWYTFSSEMSSFFKLIYFRHSRYMEDLRTTFHISHFPFKFLQPATCCFSEIAEYKITISREICNRHQGGHRPGHRERRNSGPDPFGRMVTHESRGILREHVQVGREKKRRRYTYCAQVQWFLARVKKFWKVILFALESYARIARIASGHW